MPEIQIIAKDNHKTLVTTEGTSAKLSEASVVLVKVAASDVLVVNREGTNAVIRLKNGETIVIEGFFSGTAEPKDNSLVFQDENGQLIWAKFKDAENDADADSDADADADSDVEPQALLGEDLPAALPAEAPQELVSDVIYQPISSIEPLLYDDAGVNPWLWAAIPLVAGGIIAAASNHDSNDDSSTPTDTTPPATPSVPSGYLDNVGPDQGIKGSGSSTDDTTPGVVISAPGAGETPTLYVDGEKVAASYDPVTGTLTPTTPLADGSHQLTYTLTDAAGNESAQSPAITVTVDTLAPATPSVPSGYLDNVGPDQGIKGSGSSTDDTTPGVVISAPGAGETPTLYVDGEKVAASYDPVTGTLTPTTPLADGSHQLTYTLTDAAGNESAQSPAITVTVDTLAPATPSVPSGYLDNVGPDQGIKGSGSSTDDTTPGVVISAPGAGETPTLYVDGEKVAASYDPVTGTLTPTTPLADGSHQLTYTLTDAAGNESAQSPAITVTVDTLAPATPSVPSGYLDNVGPDQGIKGSGSSTDDTTPGVVISAPGAGETPTLYVDGEKVAASYDPVTGTLTPTTPLADGSHQLTYTLTDAAGNESAQSPAITVTVDTLAPATPSVPSGYLDNVGPDQGIKGSGSSTDDTTPGVVISAPGAGETPTLYVDGEKVAASYDPVTGTLTPTTPLADGSHQLTYTLTDAAGNESAQSPAITVTVDTLAPATPSVPSGYLDNVGPDQGIKGSGSSTDDTTPGVVISAPGAGETPTLYVDGEKVAASYDPVTGTLTPTTPLADGSHQLTYTLTDAAGNESAQSPAITVTVDTLAPATPSVPSGYLDNVGPDQGIKGSGSSTDDTTPGVVISAPGAGETPTLYVDGEKVAASYDPVTGTLTPTTPLADGSHQLTYTLTDAAGNESAQSPAITVTVDTLAPATPSVPSGYLDNVGPDQGIKGSGSSTDDTTPGVVISAPGAGETPTLYVDGEKVAASYDPVTGTLTPTTPLADGSHQLTYTLTDAAGNESAQSPAITVTVDTLAPATPSVPSGYLDNVGPDQGIKGSGSSTDDTTPGVVISAPGAGETPTLYVDGEKVAASYDPVTGTLTPTTPLADGSHQLTYTLTDAAGNESAQSPAITVTVDTLAPATPSVPSGYLDNVGPDQGIKGSGSSTDDTTPGVVISAPGAGETPTLYVDGEKVAASYDPVTGTLTPTTPLADGSHQLTYTLTDAAGNESAQSPAITVTVDTLAPATPSVPSGYLDNVGPDQGIKGSGSSTDDTTPGVVISAPGAGETPTLYVDGEKVAASYDPVTGTLTPTTPLADGSHQLTYTLTDAAGNESAQSPAITVTVDTLAPATPSVPSGYLDNVGPDQGIKGSGSSTDDTTPGVVISAPGAGETPTLYVDGEKVAASYDPVTGTLTPTTPLADGSHQLTYTLTDAAGNESAQSPAITVTVDTLAPATPSVPSGYLDNVGPDQGIKGSGSSTDDTTPGVVISAPGAGETPTLYVDGEKVAASYDPVTGTLTPTTPLADGSHQLTYTLTDAAGNESAQSPAITVTVDTLAPATPSVPSGYLDNVGPDQGIKGSGSSTDDTTPGVVISAPGAGETPTLYVDGEKVAASYDPVTGTLTPTTPLADGSHQLTYTLTDAAGNESAQSPAITVTVDTTAPVLTISTSDLVLASGEAATITFEFSEPVSEFSVSDVVVSGGVLSNFIQVDANTWTAIFTQSGSVAPSISVADGAYTDIVGNTGKGDVLDGADGFIFNPLAVDLIGEITIPADINNDNILNANELGADKTFTAQITLGSDAAVGNIISVNGINYTVVQADLDAGFITAEIIVTVDGDLSVRAEARDSAGNTDIADTTIKVITVDTTAPITPSAPTGYLDNVGPDQGIKGSGSSTDDTTPGVVISAPGAGETPTLYVDGEKVAASYDPVTGTLTPTTPLADGSHQLTYTLTDAAGNESVQSPALLLTVDTTAPSLVITALDPALTATESTTISFTFSEAVSGFDIDDITPVGGTLSNLVQSTTNPNVWTATFTADGSGAAPSISVADGAYTDLAGNLGTGDVLDGTDGFVVDTLAPAPVITIDPVTNAITIDFGEAVNAVDGSPLTADALEGLLDIANGKLTDLVDNGDGSFSGTLVPAADFEGDVVVNVPAGIVTDVAGNANLTATESLTVDTLAPGLVITALDPALTATESTTISFTFSEAVSGFDIDDITPVGGTLSNLVQSTTNPNVWTATFTADGSGAAPSISVADGAYTDLAGNLGTGDVLDGTDGFVVDTLAPAPVITIDPVTNAITIDFGEAVNAVDGSPLTADALEGLLDIANGKLTDLVDNGDGSFSGTLVPAADFEGDVVVNVPAGIVTDVAGNANLTATESLTVDTLAPGLVITALDPALTATESTTISFTFSEAVSGFDIDDITPVGGTLSNLVQSTTNPNVWTATFTADGSGAAPSISVADGAYTDLAGNLGTGDVLDGTDGFVVDTLAPAPVITIDPVTNAITIDFGEAVNAVDGSPLTADALEGLLDIANGKLTDLVDNGDGSFSGTLVPAADFEGDVVVNVPAGIVTDVAGNANLTATESLTVDTLAPGLVITALDPALTATESTTISFTFSEAVSGFDIDDITPVGGTLSNLVQSTTNPNVWTATFTADGSGAAPSISVADGAYTDLAGNLGTGDVLDGTDGFVVDTLAPAPVITIDPVTNAITIDFGEAVNAVDGSPLTADALEGLLDIANGTLTGLVDNGDGSFSGTLVPAADFEGDVVVNVPAGIVTDVAGNANLTATESLTVDTLAPGLVITALDPALTATESTTISFTFSEAVSGFDIDDITPVGGTLSNLVQSTTNPNVWTATFTADGSGAAPSISVADGAYTDLAGNLGTGDVLDGTDGFVVDTLAPAPVITIDPVTNAITIDFGEAVNAVDGSPLTADALEGLLDIANGTLTGLVDNGDGSFSGTLVPAADFEGDVVVNVPAGIVTDVAGNANLTATESLTVDTLAPGLVITALDPALTATESTTISFTFSEAVSGFDIDDITPVGGTLSNLVQSTTNPNVWTATFTADGSGAAPSISVADGAYTDLAGNLGTGDVLDGTDGFVVDTLAPAPVITIDPVTNAITIDFGEAVNAVDGSPLTADALEGLLDIANGTLTDLVDNGDGSFSGTLVPAADFEGDVVVNVPAGIVTDVAGNANLTATESLTVDTLAPGLVITALDPALTATESTTISFTFSEAVSGFDIDDITPVGGTLSNLVQSTTNPNVWTATFTADGSGAAPSISVADGAYTDLAGNLGTGDVLDGTDGFVVDTLAPAPVITIDPVTNAITIDFGEAVNAVDGSPLTADALEGLLDIANGTLTGLVDNGDGSFSGTLVPAADFEGDVVVNVPAGIVTDVAGNANLTATESLTVDTLAPGLVITALDPALTATESTTISFTFSEAVSGFDIDDITPVGGTLSNLVQSTTNPNVWTATFTADGSGAAPSISVADGAYTDLAGNLGTGDVLDGTDGFVVDTLAPAPVITIDPVTNAITIDFGEAVNAVDGSPLTADALEGLLDIANGKLTDLVDNGDGSFSGTLVPAADFEGDVVVNVPAGIVTDVAGNANLTATESLTVDTLAPGLVITALDPALTATESTTISFTFSEAVSGFDIDDITPVGGTLSNLVQSTTNPNVWTATFTADGSGAAPSISVADGAYTDLAGNLGTGDVLDGTDGFVVDTLAPAPVITIDPVTNAITIDFGEAVNAVDGSPLTADALEGLLDIANGTLTGLVDNGDGSFSGTLVPAADFEGDVVVNVPAGIVTDVAGNANLTATESLTVDTLAPGLVITALDPALTATESTTISFTFSEAVSGFDIDDITPVGGTLSNLVQSTTNPNVWTATFTADGSGAAPSISVADGAYTDLAGNLGTGDVLDGTDGFVVDTLAPAPVITIDPVTNAITIDFGEAVNAVDGSPLTADALEGLLDIANGTLTGLVDNGDGSFSGTLVPAADFEGDVVVNVPAGIVTDVAGNANLTATESLTVDTLAPGLVITALDPALTATESTTISFTFSEAVSGFDIDDITPVGGTLSNLVQSTTNPNVWTATFTQDGTLTAPSISVADDAYTDLAGNLGKGDVFDGTDGFVVNTIDAINDNVTFDPGTFVSTIWDAPIIAQDINVLDTSIIGDTSMNVEFSVPRNSADIGTGHEGDVVIQVSQDNLIAVASGFSVLVEYFDGANWVQYTTATTTNGGLIADALGLGVLGIVDDGKTIAVHLTGVPEGQYRVVVQNDSSAIGDLLDDLTLAQLGDQGILLGADNQDAVLDAVETALNGQVLNLGTLVRNVLEPLLNIANAAGETLAVTDIVAAIVKIPLVGSLLGGVDTVLDYIADALVDNLLSVLEFTNVTINGSETYYTTPQVSGNVFDDNGSGADDRGNSDAALVTKVDGVDVPTDGTDAVIKGLYGTLYINKDGVYRYVLNGSVDSNGQVDDFTYTLSDGTHSDTAVLTISVADVIAPKAPIVSSLDETTVTGVAGAAEANSVINVYGGTDSDGDGIPDTLLGTTTANPDGSYTVTLNPAIALGDTVVVTSKDAAGNISTPTIASLHNIVALDDPNQTNYELSTTADRPNISGGIFTLANAGVLGDLIDLDLSATSAPGVTVGTNEQITLTLTASGSTGLDISAVGNLIDAILGGNIGGSLDLIIAKQTSTGSYEVYNTIANAYTLNNNVLTFTASGSQSISLDDAGVYKFILAPNSSTSSALSNLLSLNLLGNLILSSNDVVATINNTDLITGNVLSNDTAAPIGLDLSIVSIKETTAGVDETVVSGTPKVIEGMYGTLTIDSTGAYSYQMTANATALGKVEAFTYTVQDNDGHSKQATIYIRLDSNLVTLDWTGKTGLEEANKLVTQLTADNKASAGTVTTLFDQVLNGSGDSSNSIQVTGSNGVLPTSPPETGSTAIPDDSGRFTLGAGQTAYISFTSILPSNVTQDFGFLGGGNQTSAYNVVIELERDGGTLAFDTQLATWTSTTSGTKYYYKVTNTGNSSANYDLNIGYGDGSIAYNWTNTTGKTFGINNIQLDIKDTTYTASSVSGDLISNDILYSSVFKIGVAAGSTTPSNYLDANSTPIVGAYGTLTVNLDGTYSYQANGKIADLGKDDVFTYKIETLDGTVNTQTLTIKVDADNVLIGTPDAGTTGNDIAVSQSANEVFTLGDGADLLIYNVLNGSSPTGGNGTDQWLDFNMSEGDKIDVSSLLSGATTDNINNYLSVSISGNQVTLLVDRDGSSGGISTPTALLTLTNEDHATNPITSLVDLLNNNSIIY
ncbi:Ig-like domain-containing protein [Acinetobacter baumannii]|uniref:Ig-like domain-containing protein n=1 Tax=Acinetobacter baumannii TaxID=470 RepID=UPI0025A548D7|nr:Ig-like domain-containing protein [Acinetobacter baumannii]MDM8389883.1 Ig-like domain-containing protein [Acinetobacter baumannii]